METHMRQGVVVQTFTAKIQVEKLILWK